MTTCRDEIANAYLVRKVEEWGERQRSYEIARRNRRAHAYLVRKRDARVERAVRVVNLGVCVVVIGVPLWIAVTAILEVL